MPKAKPKAPENVALMTSYVDQQERPVIVLAVVRGVARAFAVAPENRGEQALERAASDAKAAATAWAQERCVSAVEWRAPRCLPLPDGRNLGLALSMVAADDHA